jgi:hypothetical protein
MSDEQRKQMLEAHEKQSIQKVTEVELTEAAFKKGREVARNLDEQTSLTQADSMSQAMGVTIRWLAPGSAHAHEIETQIIEAYINSVLMGEQQTDNVQRVGPDSLVYTKVIVTTRSDSSVEVKGTWNVWLSKKNLILEMNKN